MTAYIVFTREKLRDPAAIKEYGKAAAGAREGHNVKTLAAYGKIEVKEGPEIAGVVILEFPTFEEAKAWYESPAYQAACEHRFKGADYRAVIVQGL